ncbi:MAG: fibronectin type III domain-containing protein [Patescibacteria group bacterium]|jgi:hypothetical protein
MRLGLIGLIVVGIFSITGFTFAEMSSPSYQIDWDTISTGGGDTGASSSHEIKDTIGNSGAGIGSSVSYSGQAGYRVDYIPHITPPGGGEEPPPPEPETGCAVDLTGPVISEVSAGTISANSAIIYWTTSESAPGHVDYGMTTSYATGTESETGEIIHTVSISGLSASTTYYYQIEATDTCGNLTTSSGYSFTTTAADLAPANVASFTATAEDGFVSLSWVSPTDGDFAGTLIIFCLDAFPSDHADVDCSTIYVGTGTSYTHSGLTNGTTYYYGAFSYDTGGNFASGALASATPVAILIDVCGDGTCGSTETSESCPSDCPVIPVEVCGDGSCNGSETTGSCPADCAVEVPVTDVCGDSVCGSTETAGSCPADCYLAPTGDVCGDGACGGSESSLTCLTDCGVAPSGETTCGNAVCEDGETSNTCSSDCPSIEIPTTTVEDEELIPFTDLSVISSDGGIDLPLSETGGVTVLSGTDISFFLSKENVDKEISEVILTLGADTYLLQNSDLYYFTTIAIPTGTANYAVYLIIRYQDGTDQTFEFLTKAASWGLVFEKDNGEEFPVSDATVTLYESVGGDWKIWTPKSGQSNPISTSSSGSFAWYVENGTYRVTVNKDGYEEKTSTLTISNNIVSPIIEIAKKVELSVTVENTIREVTENVTATVTETVTAITETFETVKESPVTQTTATIAAPAVTAVAVTSTVLLATSFNLLPFLQYLFTAPILLLGRRKRKSYGVVYNAFTKAPLDLATVRLYSVAENKLVRSRVTDKGGKYFFMVQPGKYRISINKSGYEFPSSILSGKKDDGIYLDVYHGEEIEVTEKDVVITPNIPIEPVAIEEKKEVSSVKRIRALRTVQHWFALAGIFVSIFVFLVQMSIWTGVALGVQLVVFLLIRRLATSKKPKSWGIVYDQKTQRPIGNVVVRIFEPKYHKLLETGLTDNQGRYTFLLGPSEYSSTFEKTGYEQATIQPIDYSQEKETKEWAQDIALSPKGNTPPPKEETK